MSIIYKLQKKGQETNSLNSYRLLVRAMRLSFDRCVLVTGYAYSLPAMRTLNYLCVLITGYAPPLSPMRIHRRLCALTPLCTSPVKNNDNLHKKRAWMYLLKEIQSCP